MALSPEHQSAQMSKILNGGLDLYGKVQSLKGIGSERVTKHQIVWVTHVVEYFATGLTWQQYSSQIIE